MSNSESPNSADVHFDIPSSNPEPSDSTESFTEEHPAPSTKPEASVGGPLNLEQIRRLREQQTQAAQKPKSGKQRSPSPKPATERSDASEVKGKEFSEKDQRDDEDRPRQKDVQTFVVTKVEVPSVRGELGRELDRALTDALDGLDLDRMLVGDPSVQIGRRLEEGQRYPARVIKVHNENVFMSLGGPDEGIVPVLQFPNYPKPGDQFDCIVRSYSEEEGIYQLAIPGEAVNVADWTDIEEGAVVEARIESANTGGLECKVGNIRAFIPMSQISEFRVDTPADYVGKKLLCVVAEANMRRGNLVLSHRAVLEREKAEKRKEKLASLDVGQAQDGVVRKVMDFGAFVDIGGVDGLIHLSQLSWDRVKHPSDVVAEGDRIRVRIEKVDPETGKISLSYRALQAQPWDDVDTRFPIGAVVKGTVTRIATFGAFVKLAPGIEGLVHISELANHRVTNVANAVSEGQEVEVKVLSTDKSQQRMGLSIRQAAAKAKMDEEQPEAPVEPITEEAPRSARKTRNAPLKGGIERTAGGDQFGLKW